MNDFILTNLGKEIRRIRQEKELKLHDIAIRADVSKGLLSKIENGRTMPSLPVLVSIIRGLNIDVGNFFNGIQKDHEHEYIHKTPEEYSPIEKDEAFGFIYNFILNHDFSRFTIEAVVLDLMPGSKREAVTTDGYEFKYVLEGEVDYYIGEEMIKLKKGDTLFFNASTPHVPVNKQDHKATILVIYFLIPRE
ncbi:MAG: helix-turn-helix domain-containing protein [Candidatus Cyclobacteriaceae bacterium M3_2C_046]